MSAALPLPGFLPPVLSSARVTLRPLEERDAPALFALYSDEEVMRYWSHPAWSSIRQAHMAIDEARADYAACTSLHYALEHKSSKTLIGSCALYAFVPQNRCATLGYLLARQYWRQGLLSEIMLILLNFAFAKLDLNRIEAEVIPTNAGSVRVLEKLGFRQEGHMRERWILSGQKYDTASYGLLRSEWCGDESRVE